MRPLHSKVVSVPPLTSGTSQPVIAHDLCWCQSHFLFSNHAPWWHNSSSRCPTQSSLETLLITSEREPHRYAPEFDNEKENKFQCLILELKLLTGNPSFVSFNEVMHVPAHFRCKMQCKCWWLFTTVIATANSSMAFLFFAVPFGSEHKGHVISFSKTWWEKSLMKNYFC